MEPVKRQNAGVACLLTVEALRWRDRALSALEGVARRTLAARGGILGACGRRWNRRRHLFHSQTMSSDEVRANAGGTGAPPEPHAPNRAPDLTREYGTADITVQWYASRCIHSANCVRALHRVFDPKRRPWVEPAAASPDEIAAAILRCPSGALHFVRHDGGAQEAPDRPATLTPIRDGPLYARGDLEIRALDGSAVRRGTRVSLCRCALSAHAPFCDNSCRAEHWHEPNAAAAESTGGPESAPPSDAGG
jgi:uncharacterized Fe-S cluster protein YjdI/CDGSH-type Zn-finger protein